MQCLCCQVLTLVILLTSVPCLLNVEAAWHAVRVKLDI